MIIEGKVAIVIGGARGIGQAYCDALLQKGAKVTMADVEKNLGSKTVEEFWIKYGESSSLFVPCDNTKDEDIANVFKQTLGKFGKPDIVIHNAGIIHEFEWQRCYDINVGGVVRTCNEALKYMSKDKGGKGGVIINTASISSLRPEDWGPVYSSTKHAVLGYTLSWALPKNFLMTGVRFNCVCPTTVDTEFIKLVTPERALRGESKEEDLGGDVDKMLPAFVAQGMIKLVEDDSLNGKALRVTSKYGHDFAEFQEQPIQ